MRPFLAFLQGSEIAIILLLVLLFFGAAKIPELARSLGRAKGEFERGSREGKELSKKETTVEDAEDARVRKAARELGIPVDGRPLADVKADLRGRL